MLITNCSQCIFNLTRPSKDKAYIHSCLIDRDLNEPDCSTIEQYALGFCRHKRNINWHLKNKDITIGDIHKIVDKEGSSISFVILHDTFVATAHIIDIIKTFPIDMEVIVSCQKASSHEISLLLNYLKESNLEYKIDNDIDENSVPERSERINNLTYIINKTWFIVLDGCEIVSADDINTVLEALSTKNNYAAFYYDENNYNKMFVNTQAFKEMYGNFKINWFDKIKESEDWRKVCLKVSQI